MSLKLPERISTTPIATNCTHSATISQHWFVERTTYDPAECAFYPLVNGKQAFGEIHDAISAATKSIDIICWGFQPSMHFKRSGTANHPNIGQLLEKKAREGIKVRLLRWDSAALAQLDEDPAPGDSLVSRSNHLRVLKFSDLRTTQQRQFDQHWYQRAKLSERTRHRLRNTAPPPLKHHPGLPDMPLPGLAIPNLDYAVRDFDGQTRRYIGEVSQSPEVLGATPDRAVAVSSMAMQTFPSHHQKMVLIDYDAPAHAVGFLMGHNMLDAYWDDDGHSATRREPERGRNGATPRQDISSRLHGPILRDLNRNFCQAWDEATGQDLSTQRKAFDAQHQPIARCFRNDGSVALMAQVLRTQPQYEEQDILTAYRKAINNATQFIYIENQYFRYPQLAEQIKHTITTQCNWGRDIDRHGPLHVFVVTNATDDGIGKGTVRTYAMLQALGQGQGMPKVAYGEQKANLRRQYQEACNEETRARAILDRIRFKVDDTPEQNRIRHEQYQAANAQLQQAHARQADLQQQMHGLEEPTLPTEIKGLKVHVCSLVAPDSPPQRWEPVYIHSKLMIVDDVFTTLGSANINVRSMVGDSELNICHETGKATKPLRKHLWKMHTGGMGDQDSPKEAFKEWGKVLNQNNINLGKKLAPIASLVNFLYTGDKRGITGLLD